ncbi:hypothetical protein FB545_1932 [Peribacillus frigoritolerans]|nr:hypothetical protein FB545_1932 [Peribacillus frigoritolerans]
MTILIYQSTYLKVWEHIGIVSNFGVNCILQGYIKLKKLKACAEFQKANIEYSK